METNENAATAKKIIEKYRFSELAKLSKDEILDKFKVLFNDSVEMEVSFELLSIKYEEATKKITALEIAQNDKPKYQEFNSEWTGIEKVIYILKENAKALKSDQIENELLSIQPSLQFKWRVARTASLKYLTRAVNYGLIIKYKPHNHFVYCLPEWFDSNNDLLAEFKQYLC
ncbi:MAG: hypothetical protein Q8L81_16665 [Bacteroidota bacterium]|nr:hypothetical protein [Bacteroidota bacterium]